MLDFFKNMVAMRRDRNEAGASAVEYGLLVGGIAAIIVVLVFALGSQVSELFYDTCTAVEGQTTAHYLAERLEGYPVRLTQLAHGLPVGGELDYLDEGTLAQALRARRPVG